MLDPCEETNRRKFERVKRYFLTLARRAQTNREDAEMLSQRLGGRVAELWEPALDAAIKAEESPDNGQVHPLIDAVIAKSLRDKPDLRLISDLYNRLPLDSIQLKKTSVEVFSQMVLGMEQENRMESFPAAYLNILNGYVMRLVQVGSLADAQFNAKKALQCARELCKTQPDEFQDELIDSLETVAVVTSGLGQLNECREAREEAINLLRARSAQDRKAKLAQCLNNLSGSLASLSEFAGALECSEEAVIIYRELVEQRVASTETNFSGGLQAFVDDLRPAFADALIALSSHQNRAERFEESLVSARKAYEFFSELSDDFPDQFRHHFAMARHNLGMAKIGVGDLAGGVHEMKEAAEVYKALARVHPGAFTPAYAHILGSLALALVKNQQIDASLIEFVRCVNLYRDLNNQTPGGFVSDFARNLNNLMLIYLETGQADKAKLVNDELALLKEDFHADSEVQDSHDE